MKRAMALGTSSALSNRRSSVLTIADVPTPQPRPDTQFARARPLSTVAEWYAVAKQRLRTFGTLADNWNDEGAVAISPAVIALANRLLLVLRDANAPRPFMAALTIGGIGFEWEAGARELTLNVLPDDTIEFVRADRDGDITDGLLTGLNDSAIRRQVTWLRGEL